jgi:hypothetical protein
MNVLLRAVGIVVAAVAAFVMMTGTMILLERWTGRTPEQIGIVYGLGQIVLWAAFTTLIIWLAGRFRGGGPHDSSPPGPRSP